MRSSILRLGLASLAALAMILGTTSAAAAADRDPGPLPLREADPPVEVVDPQFDDSRDIKLLGCYEARIQAEEPTGPVTYRYAVGYARVPSSCAGSGDFAMRIEQKRCVLGICGWVNLSGNGSIHPSESWWVMRVSCRGAHHYRTVITRNGDPIVYSPQKFITLAC